MRLLEPFYIRDVELKNRVVMSPMITNLGTPEGYPTEEHIMYFVRRASAGLLITEYTYVNKVDARGSPNQLGLYDDELIPKFARLTEAVHNMDSKIFVQLVHVGRKTRRGLIWNNQPIAPSNIPLLDPVREMTEDDINRVITDFVKASERAEKSGFDGIELHGAHGYLIAQFLSPATNKREDKYKDGVIFLEELLKEIRRVVSIPVGMRISVTEFDPQGLTPELVAKIVKRVENLLDYVHLSAGRDGPLGGSSSFYYKRPSYVDEAKVVRKTTSLPLLLVGSVSTVEDAEKVLEVADAVVLARQILADPDWVVKVRNNLPIRPCIRCNQLCRLLSTREVRCDVNPELGWEILKLEKGEGEVKIVGGGVMGLETARVLALRGFEVKLYEKDDKIGGQLNEIRDPWKKAEFMRLIDYYEKELKRLGVKIYLSTEEREADIFALPRERQPEFKEYKGMRILVNSNLYAYQDYVFEWVKHNEVYVTENVFKGLDRNRGYLLQQKYKELGVGIVKENVKADVIINDVRRNQPTIGQSIARGYWLGMTFKPKY
ncbi:oxidoreductase [Sulfurisphaera ohwakuensis]|uniref:2,4-dienoyl-CoA reductase-like NADH-dependent reductase (Old Yellow Enzyme family) n=1 Tax=Sulfurisphaera ohwakuensis TaxID=69656 RepID=A0A650CLI5_SULOH|nr:NAD(P)-binding protein [Sulfurisphaera ohwakuensis]MBB5253690.1 2,4-dienoyl-CoA reductase-like NADH-dependent reductase (Old Yellow Enzyme family) [Sulfurisphaera ohwakuensis]QGR18327.1 NAD(P)-binding protein [Sulfurisphaera ohwakuensis]